MRRLRTALLALALTAGLASSLGAVPASATVYVWNQSQPYGMHIYPGGPWAVGDPHSITDVGASLYANGCVGAIDYYGGTLAGSGYCSTSWGPLGYVVHHPYCGCVLRDPAVYPYTGDGWLYYGNATY